LNNLISNAIKYKDVSKEESFVTIFVECDNENAIITIEDNGIGIAEDKQGRVFEMFYRATKLPLAQVLVCIL
jgi:signal transduction histidine kinase